VPERKKFEKESLVLIFSLKLSHENCNFITPFFSGSFHAFALRGWKVLFWAGVSAGFHFCVLAFNPPSNLPRLRGENKAQSHRE
jgi:hypothetical protein